MTAELLFPELSDERPLPLRVADQWQFPLAHHTDKEGKEWYAIQDWLRGLTQQEDTRKIWAKMQTQMSTSSRRLAYKASDGKTYERDFTDDKGLYLIAQHLRTTKDRPLLRKIKELRIM